MSRRAFLVGTLGAAGTVLTAGAAGCQAATHRGPSQIHHTSQVSTGLGGDSAPHGGDRIHHRPNDGSGLWADLSNTGYRHDPGYTSSGGNCTHGYAGLTDYAPDMEAGPILWVDEEIGHVFSQIHFRGTVVLGHNKGDNWTFNGCVFDNGGGSYGEQNFITQSYLPTLHTYNYCTFKPCDYALPPGNDGTVSSSHTPPGTPWHSSYQSFNVNYTLGPPQTGKAAVRRYRCDIWGNAGMQDVFNGTSDRHVVLDWCYIHDQADTNWSTAIAAGVPLTDRYHHDGIGPTPGNEQGWIDVTNCTIASLGTSNALAFQECTVHDCVIAGCYISGFGIPVNLGGSLSAKDYNITFTDNVYSGELPYMWRIMYWNWDWDSDGRAILWRRNRLQFFDGDPTMTFRTEGGATSPNRWRASYHGKYWWPSDNNPHDTEYTG
jgi:hypothetical protein